MVVSPDWDRHRSRGGGHGGGLRGIPPSLVLNQGTAGGYPEGVQPFDLVLGEQCTTAMPCSRAGMERIISWTWRPWKGKARKMNSPGKNPSGTGRTGKCWPGWTGKGSAGNGAGPGGGHCSGDRWNDCPDTIRALEQGTGALCEEMETAGAGETAARFGVPFGAVRVISNNNRTGEPFNPETARALQEWIVRVMG